MSEGFRRGTEGPMDYENHPPSPSCPSPSSPPPTHKPFSSFPDLSFGALKEGEIPSFKKRESRSPSHRKSPKEKGYQRQNDERNLVISNFRGMMLSENSNEENFVPTLDPPKPSFLSHLSSFLGYIRTLDPNHLIGYIQLFYNLGLLLVVCLFSYQFVQTIRRDIGIKAEAHSKVIEEEIQMCASHFKDNRCSIDQRVPAMEKQCLEWETCMSQNPRELGWTRISAETIAEIINSFVEPISVKTMIFIFGFMIAINLCLSLMRYASNRSQPLTPTHSPFPSPFSSQPPFPAYPPPAIGAPAPFHPHYPPQSAFFPHPPSPTSRQPPSLPPHLSQRSPWNPAGY